LLSTNKLKTFNISNIVLTDSVNKIYEIQSDETFLKEDIDKLNFFENGYEILHNFQWEYAYPDLVPFKPENLPEFLIADNIYHINAMESVVSTMETSIISSRNIVNLIEEKFNLKKEERKNGDL